MVVHRQAASGEGAREMSVVSEHLVSLIAKQVEDYQLVVWYDPEQVLHLGSRGPGTVQDDGRPIRGEFLRACGTRSTP